MEILNRESIDIAYKWKVEDIMREEDIPSFFEDIKAGFAEISSFKGKLNPENCIECFLVQSKISYKLEKLYVFVHLKSDEDKSVTQYTELLDRVTMLSVEFSTVCSFISPTVANFRKEELIKMRDSEKYSYFSMYIDSLIRNKKRLLSPKEEAILANVSSFSDEFDNIFGMFDNIDVNLSEIEVDGKKQKLSHGLFSVMLQNSNQEVRKKAYDAVYNGYISMINTIAANYSANVKQDYFWTRMRKYKSCLDKALSGKVIPVSVYNNLISVVKKYTPILHEYVALRKKALNLSEMYMYDMYVPIVKDRDKLTDYETAYKLVTDALKPLGEEYVKTLLEAKDNGWIDVFETKNKRSGAYSFGVYGTHPYVLLNHRGTTHDIFTIAHEMGHAMHSYYSNNAQCYEKAGYVIFVAEIASTVNEVLLIKHLLKTAVGEERKYLLSYYIDMIRTTLFRQTMFAEFEKFAHETIENNDALSAEKMTEYYGRLNKEYYGESVITDNNIAHEWARIPHFYRDFYVYQYATGITCAINIANMILNDSSAVGNYKKFLSAGGSKYPMDILNLVGLDLTKKEPFEVAMKEFSATLKELKKTMRDK